MYLNVHYSSIRPKYSIYSKQTFVPRVFPFRSTRTPPRLSLFNITYLLLVFFISFHTNFFNVFALKRKTHYKLLFLSASLVRGTWHNRFTNDFNYRSARDTTATEWNISNAARTNNVRSLAKYSTYHRHYRNRGDRARILAEQSSCHNYVIGNLLRKPSRSVIPPAWFIIDSWLTLSLLGKCIHELFTGWPTCHSVSISLSVPWQNEIPRVDEPSFHRAAVCFSMKIRLAFIVPRQWKSGFQKPISRWMSVYLLTGFVL